MACFAKTCDLFKPVFLDETSATMNMSCRYGYALGSAH